MKKLPKIYQNKINKTINNNNTVYYCTTNNEIKEDKDINKFLDNLFNERGYIFNKALIIKTKDKEYDTAIIRRNSDSIFTLSEDKIYINDIIYIIRK